MDNIKSLEFPKLKAVVAKYSPFLVEVRKRILFTLSVFAVATLVGFFFYEKIIKFLIDILGLRGVNIVFTSPFQFINLAISCGVATGLVLTFPLLIIQILSFLKPALKEKEYKMIVRFLPFSLFLFLIGFAFGALIMKWQIEIFFGQGNSHWYWEYYRYQPSFNHDTSNLCTYGDWFSVSNSSFSFSSCGNY